MAQTKVAPIFVDEDVANPLLEKYAFTPPR